jgi:hypothetical protein
MSWGARTMNLHSQLISSNGSGSFGGQGGLDFFLLTLRKQREKKNTHTHTHTQTHTSSSRERSGMQRSAKQKKQSKAKENDETSANFVKGKKKGSSSKQARKREFLGSGQK